MSEKYDFEWVELESSWSPHERNKGGFRLSWGCRDMSLFGLGWGTITFYVDNNDELQCDNEFMSEEFVKQALLYFASKSKFRN